jgi:hypothetical protein
MKLTAPIVCDLHTTDPAWVAARLRTHYSSHIHEEYASRERTPLLDAYRAEIALVRVIAPTCSQPERERMAGRAIDAFDGARAERSASYRAISDGRHYQSDGTCVYDAGRDERVDRLIAAEDRCYYITTIWQIWKGRP